MKKILESVSLWVLLFWFATIVATKAMPIVDCTCVANLPELQTNSCVGVVPDLSILATNCFSVNVNTNMPGFCTQTPIAGTLVFPGTYVIQMTVTDNQSNSAQCSVPFVVTAPPAILTVSCTSNKTVECGTGWNFDQPFPTTTCCQPFITTTILSTATNGTCPHVITRTWKFTDTCSNSATCSQTVTEIDTTPPTVQCAGMNLVPNGDFESFTLCPTVSSQFDVAAPWFQPTGGTSDYYNSCSGPNSYVSTPTNSVGVQIPHSGQGYAGILVYTDVGTNLSTSTREYMEVPLITPLVAGQTYRVSYYVSLAEELGGYAIAELGAYFSAGAIVTTNTYGGVLNVVPQVVNPSTNVLTSMTSWMLVTGTFVASGGEDHLTLGNFLSDPATTAVFAGGPFFHDSYYYYDDVSVEAVCPTTVTNKTVQCGNPWTFDTPAAYDNCSGTNVTVTVASTVTNGTCPSVITRTWALTDLCGNSTNWSQTVTIVDNTPPMPICTGGNGTNLVPNGDFEYYTACPSNGGDIIVAVPWFQPSDGTCDYFNSCATFPFALTPGNGVGYQVPLSGQAYAGIFVYGTDVNIPGSSYREYLEVPLISPLVANQTYVVSFHVSRAENYASAIAEVGAHFSPGPIISNGYDQVFNFTPQVVNSSTNLLIDTTNWMLVQGTFTASGGESHLTLGNFLPDALTTQVPASGVYSNTSYYYFDDVSVEPVCTGLISNKTVLCGQPWNFDPPAGYDNCSGTNVAVTVVNTVTNGVCPRVATRTWALTDQCGNSTNYSQTVTIVDNTPPTLVTCNNVNLVPNPGFELYANCPSTLGQLDLATPWYAPTGGTADYFNGCAPGMSGVSTPANSFGNQFPLSGRGYAGGYMYAPGGGGMTNSYREYLQAPLSSPLIAGQTYSVSFHVSRAANYAWAVAELGAYFSAGPVTNGSSFVLPVSPQVENPSANILGSTNSWMLVQGTFIAAGGEDHVTIGNFRSDANTTAQLGVGTYSIGAYYYFDDVSVTPVCWQTNKSVACGAPLNFDPPIGIDNCSGTNVTVSVVNTVTNGCPPVFTRTWTLADLCGNSINVSQTITVAGTNAPLTLNCACLQDSAIAVLNTNTCTGIVPDLSVFTNCYSGSCGVRFSQSPVAGTVVGPGNNLITVSVSDCSGNSNTCELLFHVNPVLAAIPCPPDLYLLTCSTSAIANFNVGPVITSPPSGSAFPLGTNLVTFPVTNACGQVSSCSFRVIVRPVTTRWGCLTFVIAIPYNPIGTAIAVFLPDFPGGGEGVNFDNIGSSGQDGVQLLFGPAQKVTFSTVLDFNAPQGAGFAITIPPAPGATNGTLLASFRKGCTSCWDLKPMKFADDGADYRAIAIGTNGELFPSSLHDAADLVTNTIVELQPAAGVTNAVVTVTLDCLTREVSLEFPNCGWTPNAARKGWDGLIYGDGPRGTKTNKTARLVLTPLTGGTPPPITNLYLLASNLSYVAFDNPSITAMGRKWNDGHVTLMKAYDDGTETGVEFTSLDDGGGVNVDLGHSASFQFRMTHFETGDIPTEEQFNMVGWPPGTTTNRPPPPTNYLRLAPSPPGNGAGPGLGGIDCSVDFLQWGVLMVTVQLWNGTTLVAQQPHVLATTLASPVATLSGYPSIISSPSIGVLSLMDTNPITVLSGLNCSAGCTGTELRIVAEMSKGSTPPVAWSGLSCLVGNGMDDLIYALQTTPAATPVSINATATPNGVTLNWAGDGFRLQGAETLNGPWYDLGVSSPTVLPPNYTLRVFRLISD